jgi:hypothetical protein
MYQLYVEQCKGKIPEKEVVSHAVYKKLFNEEYNFSFHVPKKDQCALYINYYRNKNQDTLRHQNKRLHVFWYLAMTSVEGKGMFRSHKIPSERPLLTKDNR